MPPHRHLLSVLWSLIILLVLSSGPAYAEWVKIYSNQEAGRTSYADPDTIRRKGDLVKMWILLDFKALQTEADASYLSSLSQIQYDCAEERYRSLSTAGHAGNMGQGDLTWANSDQTKWQPIPPRTVANALLEFACKKR